MAFLSQASHLGSLLLPHDAFQEHAAHRAEWPAQLSSKGSEHTCIRSSLTTFLHDAFTAYTYLVVAQEPSDVESNSRLDFLWPPALGTYIVA
jgi:hypothetical protein